MKNTGERLIPDLVKPDDALVQKLLSQHLERYALASQFCKDKRVLDLACGSGYGSRLLLDSGAREVHGVDRSQDIVAYASTRYGAPNLAFSVGDAETYENGVFDVITSFETLEHLPNPAKFLSRVHSMLASDGVLIVSATTIPTRDFYAFHLHDVDDGGFRSLLTASGYDVSQEVRQRAFFTLQELGKASRQFRGTLPVRRLIFRPLHGIYRGWQTLVSRGVDYSNLTLVCRPRQI